MKKSLNHFLVCNDCKIKSADGNALSKFLKLHNDSSHSFVVVKKDAETNEVKNYIDISNLSKKDAQESIKNYEIIKKKEDRKREILREELLKDHMLICDHKKHVLTEDLSKFVCSTMRGRSLCDSVAVGTPDQTETYLGIKKDKRIELALRLKELRKSVENFSKEINKIVSD